jgi:uncharacterized caspase-like protein
MIIPCVKEAIIRHRRHLRKAGRIIPYVDCGAESRITLECKSYCGWTEACETRNTPKSAISAAGSGLFAELLSGAPPGIGIASGPLAPTGFTDAA